LTEADDLEQQVAQWIKASIALLEGCDELRIHLDEPVSTFFERFKHEIDCSVNNVSASQTKRDRNPIFQLQRARDAISIRLRVEPMCFARQLVRKFEYLGDIPRYVGGSDISGNRPVR
jgi:hypothetical protein